MSEDDRFRLMLNGRARWTLGWIRILRFRYTLASAERTGITPGRQPLTQEVSSAMS